MSKKIIFDEILKQEILTYIKNTYQCTLTDVCNHFNVSRNSINNNFDKDEINNILFHGCKDSKRQKLHDCNVGKTQSEEVVRKRILATKETVKNRDPEKTKEIYERALKSKAEKFGSIEDYYKYQSQKSKETKLERYGDENYNNMNKNKATKLERYGDPNYNNQSQIKETQFNLYGGYAFNDKEKYETTMLERYEVRHNWASDDPKLNGRYTMYKNAGSKELHYQQILSKGRKTRKELYGYEFYSNSEQAQATMLEKYGVPYYCMTERCQELGHTQEANNKRIETKRINHSFNISQPEIDFYNYLVNKFGINDIIKEYNDERYASSTGYKYNCDFYIKSKDLFIELNLHPTHGEHPFNQNDEEDMIILNRLLCNQTPWNKTTIDVWTIRDPEKISCAIKNNLNYLYFYPGDNYYDVIERI